ncbi:MAG: ECF transporter S component, partial [Dehalococcoidia bacterium]
AAHLGRRGEVAMLIAFGMVWGLLFGAITNLWFWPFWPGGPDISYDPSLGLAESLRHYWNFYLVTSLGWDLMRSVCNAVVLVFVGGPLVRALVRFHDKVEWGPIVPAGEAEGPAGAGGGR